MFLLKQKWGMILKTGFSSRGKMNSLNVAVVGIGNVGLEVASQIVDLKNEEYWDYEISGLLLISEDQKKLAENAAKLAEKKRNIRISYSPLNEINKNNPDIVINCASAKEARNYKDRRKMGEVNLQINRDISSIIPKDALEIIVTNHTLTLPYDAVRFCNRKPELTIGLTHIDSIRARIAVRKLLDRSIKKEDNLDLSDVFMIGSHDDYEMFLAHATATINNIYFKEFFSLRERKEFIERFATEFAHEQIRTEGTTKHSTAEAVAETLKAACSQNSYVSASVLCNFNHAFFRADPDFFDFEKPEEPLYMNMRTGFNNLKASIRAANDKKPEMAWFIKQDKETKSKFYKTAIKQHSYTKRLLA